jgi:HEPN domain-containing protein
MSNSGTNQAVVPAASVHSYAFNLYRLESEVRRPDPDVEAVVELMDSLRRLQGIPQVGVVGDEAEHCIEYFVTEKVDSPEEVSSVSLSDSERKEIGQKTHEWIERFERHLGSAVAQSPATEIPPNELLGGSHELLAEHVGERFEPEVRDLNEAASNLCAGAYTSTEFMCIRAVERLLRKYFREEMGEKSAAKDWSRALETVAADVEDRRDLPEELRILEHLQERRRELVRPESHSTQDDAETTLMKTFRLVDALIDSM